MNNYEFIKKSNLKKYGVENPFQLPDIIEKIRIKKIIGMDIIKENIKNIFGDLVVLDESTYKQATEKARFIDKIFGFWWALPTRVSRGKSLHSSRAALNRKKTLLEKYGRETPVSPLTFKEVRIVFENNDLELLSDVYKNAHSPLKCRCKKCSNVWNITYANVHQRYSCPQCSSCKSQKKLFKTIKKIFLNLDCFFNFKEFVWLRSKSSRPQEIDIFVPALKLAIEYDGKQHFQSIDFFGGEKAFNLIKKLDQNKNKLISEHPEDVKTFIRIPYWEYITEENVIRILKESGVSV